MKPSISREDLRRIRKILKSKLNGGNVARAINAVLILVVRRTHVLREPCIWPCSPRVLRSLVVRASDKCTEGHRFNSCQELRFLLCFVVLTC